MYEHYLGLDLHKREIYAVLIDKNGNKLDERKFPNQDAEQYLLEVGPINTFAVLEATRNWYFLYDLLSVHVAHVELAHPNKLRAISTAAVKTDQIDASVLAQLARLNYLPVAYAAPKQLRELRLLIRHRDFLVGQRTRGPLRFELAPTNLRLVWHGRQGVAERGAGAEQT